MTRLERVNWYLAQWFCIRITRVIETTDRTAWTSIQFAVKPLTGWNGKPYSFLFGPYFIRISPKRVIPLNRCYACEVDLSKHVNHSNDCPYYENL